MELLKLPNIEDGEDKSSPFKNRIKKNYKHIRKWAKRTGTDCFRIYDRDIKEYPFAIDFYAGRFLVHYFSYNPEQDEPTVERKQEVDSVLSSLFNAGSDSIYWRTRIRRKKLEQYEKMGESKEFFIGTEYGVKFYINLVDYLDTGLFLDHREIRKAVAAESKGKRVLNLFAYTCSFSVHAAYHGAEYTKSVDLSNTYTEWGAQNFMLNALSLENHEIVRADCMQFLKEEREKYDIIVIDPPTISRSKKMEEMFDIQKDYVFLIHQSLKLLREGGTIFFSTNLRKFDLDRSLFKGCAAKEITQETFPIDFHNQKIHRAWKIKKN